MGKKKNQYIVAVKDTATEPGKILPGKVLGRFRELPFAKKAFPNLAVRECGHMRTWHCGIFYHGKLVN